MQEKEGVPQELRIARPEKFEIMAGLVYVIDQPFPTDEHDFAKGLKEARDKAPFLGVFIDEETGELNQDARSALEALGTMGLIIREDGNWKASDSGNPLNNPKDRLKSRVVGVFNQKGIAVLEEAAEVARQVWAK